MYKIFTRIDPIWLILDVRKIWFFFLLYFGDTPKISVSPKTKTKEEKKDVTNIKLGNAGATTAEVSYGARKG